MPLVSLRRGWEGGADRRSGSQETCQCVSFERPGGVYRKQMGERRMRGAPSVMSDFAYDRRFNA